MWMLGSMLGNGHDADAWCGLDRYKSVWAITSVNADIRYGQNFRDFNDYRHVTIPGPIGNSRIN